jgi:hypothetical protein
MLENKQTDFILYLSAGLFIIFVQSTCSVELQLTGWQRIQALKFLLEILEKEKVINGIISRATNS